MHRRNACSTLLPVLLPHIWGSSLWLCSDCTLSWSDHGKTRGVQEDLFLCHVCIFMNHFWVSSSPEMILRHRALSSFNMSSYQATIWTHFRPNSTIFINSIFQKLLIWTANFWAHVYSTPRKAEDFDDKRHYVILAKALDYLASWPCLCRGWWY